MDKFGIFNLLNSFLNLSEQPSPPSEGKDKQDNPLTNLLSALTSSANTGQKNQDGATKIPPSEQNAKTPQRVLPPLQNSMLSAMNSHDEFVKRVKEKNKIKH